MLMGYGGTGLLLGVWDEVTIVIDYFLYNQYITMLDFFYSGAHLVEPSALI
jgi:hypothetical protein